MRAVLELQGGNTTVGVLGQELGRARLALQDVALDKLVTQAELRQQQADLVAVARSHEVVKRQHRTLTPQQRAGWPAPSSSNTHGCARRRRGRRAPPIP